MIANTNGPVILNTQVTNVTCKGAANGSIIITANNGVGTLQYSVDNGTTFQNGNIFNNLSPGIYAAIVKDANGCKDADSISIVEPSALTIIKIDSVSSTCSNANGSLTISANGGTGIIQYSINNGISYQLFNQFNTIISGVYSVIIKDANGCTATSTIKINDAPAPVLTNTIANSISCSGAQNGSIQIITKAMCHH